MKAIVDEAHRRKKGATTHAHGAEAIKMAVRAGVESIEHGSILDEEGIQMMKERGTVLVSDLVTSEWILANGAKNNFTAGSMARARILDPVHQASFRKAVAGGVTIAFGTDAGTMSHGAATARQFTLFVEHGMTPLQALQSATTSAAALLKWSDQIGAIEPGKFADLVGVRENPLANPATLENVAFVMKGGDVVER